MIRLLAFLAVAVAAFATVLPTKKQDTAQYWFPGHVQWGPRDCTQLDASTPLNASGVHTWCTNCTRTDPCACGGPGAEARTEDGQWKCAEAGLTCADCESACVAPGGACTVTCDCCSGICFNNVCKDSISCADIGTTCNICPDVSACLLTTTTTSSTTTTTLASTTTTTTTTTTTSGTASTTTTTTTTSTTTTTNTFTSFGFVYSQNLLVAVGDRYGAGGRTGTAPKGNSVHIPSSGHIHFLSCISDLAPNQTTACNGTSIPCPQWTVCASQSNAPYDEVNFSDTAVCCTFGNVFDTCEDTVHTANIFEGANLTLHLTMDSFPPNQLRCSVEVEP